MVDVPEVAVGGEVVAAVVGRDVAFQLEGEEMEPRLEVVGSELVVAGEVDGLWVGALKW